MRADATTTRTGIPGLYSIHPNEQAQALKETPWPQLLMLLGKEGERIMIDLLVDCAIFKAVKAGKGNLYQLCGIPISELKPLAQVSDKPEPSSTNSGLKNAELRPSQVSFVRTRMLYARAALNARGLIHFGLRHIRMLARFPRK
jgi:telomerase reverse transcriptase